MRYTEQAVDRTNDALGKLYHVLAGLSADKAMHGKGYPIMAEGWVAEIFRLRKEIDDMIGLTEYVADHGIPPTDAEIDAMAPPAPAPAPSGNGAATPEPQRTAT
jgi:hypothetical protein